MKTLSFYNPTNSLRIKYLSGAIFALALLLNGLYAQRNSFFVEVNGGTNFSKFKHTVDLAELYPTANSVTGLNGGVTAGLQLQGFTLSAGAHYIQRGGQYATDNFEDQNGTAFFSAKERLHYLAIPLHVGYQAYISDRVGLSLAMGPAFNIGLGGKITESTEYFGTEDITTEHYTVRFGPGVNEDYRKLQMSFQFSPGLFVELNRNSRLTMNITWDSGLKDVYNPRYKQANTFFDAYRGKQLTRSTLLTLGYQYHFTFDDKY